MWKNPAQVTNVTAKAIFKTFQTSSLDVVKLTGIEDEIGPLVLEWCNAILGQLATHSDPVSFSRWFRKFMIAEVLKVEAGDYGIVETAMGDAIGLDKALMSKLDSELSMSMSTIATLFVSGIFVLLGTENRVLVGVQAGRPVWKDVARIKQEEISQCIESAFYAHYGILSHVSKGDAWMVPDFRELTTAGSTLESGKADYLEINRGLIEEAFYEQRYLIDPEGVYVKVTAAGEVTGLYLKVRSRGDGALVDILARVETLTGAWFIVLTEERFLHPENDPKPLESGSYMVYLVCQIYHDLVTSTTISGTRTIREGLGVGTPPSPRGDGPAWTVIPRRVRNVVREPRTEIPQRSVNEPHRVTGHLRKGAMTDKHKEALWEFERDTGLEVLRFVPDGYTFVRPHVSPSASVEDLAALPRFVRYRIQQSLEAAMQKRELRS